MLFNKFSLNTLLLTTFSLVMSCISMQYQIWLVEKIGAFGIGIYQLILSVGGFASTIAISGARFTSTILISEEVGHERHKGVFESMKSCLIYSSILGILSGIILFIFSEPISFVWIGDARTALCLKLLSLSMPFISLSSVISGYFTACGRVWKSALIHFIEQIININLVALFLSTSHDSNLEYTFATIVIGIVVSDIISFTLIFATYVFDRKKYFSNSYSATHITSRMLRIAIPLAISSYAKSALCTIEHVLVPNRLKNAGFTTEDALSSYGIIQGMVFPIIIFPSCLITAISELIIPELTKLKISNKKVIPKIVHKLLAKSIIYSSLVAIIIFISSEWLSISLYKSNIAYRYVRMFAPLIPIMYTDSVIDGCLKGLGHQIWNMAINLFDAALSVILVWLLIPVFALNAYIIIIYINEIINLTLSTIKLLKCLK